MSILVDNGNRWVTVLENGEKCLNCYHYGTHCENCKEDIDDGEKVSYAICTYEEYSKINHTPPRTYEEYRYTEAVEIREYEEEKAMAEIDACNYDSRMAELEENRQYEEYTINEIYDSGC
jgi:hypothetical protein